MSEPSRPAGDAPETPRHRPRLGWVVALLVAIVAIVAIVALAVARPLLLPPGAELARRLVETSDFAGAQTTVPLTLFRNTVFGEEDLRREHSGLEVFLELGILAVEANDVLNGVPVGARYVLTPRGEQLRQTGWQPRAPEQPGVPAWDAPMARREIVEVDEPVRTGFGTARATFRWRDVPNEVGTALNLHTEPVGGLALFRRDGLTWTLEAIR